MVRKTPRPSSAADVEVGQTLGSYELVAEIGAGAMGRVFRGRHARLGRQVAVKVLNPEYAARPDVVARFFREARIANAIDHPHIVEVTDFVEEPGLAYFVMELLEGTSLRDLARGRGEEYPRIARLVPLLAQVCEALHAAHEKGVVHRDLKPDNVFVVQRDGADFAKVLDFGVAKLADAADHAATTAGMILGTPNYMSPEQALGREVDRRADVWAAGVVLHELLAGGVPFAGRSFVELAMAIRERPPAPLPERTPRGEPIPPELAAVVARCLEKRPADRFGTMAELARALRSRRVSRAARGSPGSRRAGLAALAAVALAAGGAAVLGLGLPQRLSQRLRADVTPAWTALRDAVDDATSARPQPAPVPARAPAPPRPAARPTVELLLRSTPAGAKVVRLDTGERLGTTPLRVDVPRRAGSLWVQMTLAGFEPVKFEVDLRRDTTANVAFERAPRRTARGR